MKWLFQHLCNLFSGIILAILGYFAPIKGVIHVMVIAILIDLIFGIIAARSRKEGIKSSKLWRTAYKLFIAVIIVALLYAMDVEIGTEIIQLHRVVAWLITGFEVWSILESGGQITNHKLFRILKKYMEDKVEAVTGVDLQTEISHE